MGSIAIVRVSGEKSLQIAKKLTKKDNLPPRYAILSYIYSEDISIDECLVIYFKSPKSFTGEDIVEFQCHGGITVANMVLNEVIKAGARIADPGEFSKRAFLNGKIDLTKAEAIAKMIETKSIDAIKVLARQLRGELKNFVEEIRETLVEILAFVEVNIDYAEEDLPEDLLIQIENKLSDLQIKLKNTCESSRRREGLVEGFRVAIVGKPNVGKSSLLNSLLSYDRAIISDIAGTTRDTIEEEIKIGTHLIKIVDTAGIREAHDEIEKIGVERSKYAIENSDIIIVMFDNSREFDREDRKILSLLENINEEKHVLKVLNKSDLPRKIDISKIGDDYIEISCKKGSEAVILRLKKILDETSKDDSLLLTSQRQILAVENAYKSIEHSIELINDGELELFAFDINEAINYISSITKGFERTEILDKMFGSFCLGK